MADVATLLDDAGLKNPRVRAAWGRGVVLLMPSLGVGLWLLPADPTSAPPEAVGSLRLWLVSAGNRPVTTGESPIAVRECGAAFKAA